MGDVSFNKVCPRCGCETEGHSMEGCIAYLRKQLVDEKRAHARVETSLRELLNHIKPLIPFIEGREHDKADREDKER